MTAPINSRPPLLLFDDVHAFEPSEEVRRIWASPSGVVCSECKKELTCGELDEDGICSACYFKEVGESK